jgi:arginyl-tRNA synthetase
MLITYMREKFPKFLDEMPDLSDLTIFYKESKNRFDSDPDFKKTA